jgi:serine/threonine protein kinase
LHETGKLHRDIKPSNILVTREGRVVILDFGLVAEAEAPGHQEIGLIAGTPDYMSPEQGAQYPLTKASDWYSVGVILYQSLTGRLPFTGKYFEVIMDKQSHDPRPLNCSRSAAGSQSVSWIYWVAGRKRPGGGMCSAFWATADWSVDAGARDPTPQARKDHAFCGSRSALDELAKDLQFELTDLFVYLRPFGNGKVSPGQHSLTVARSRHPAIVLKGRCYERESVPYKALDGVVDSLSRYLMSLPTAEVAALLPRDAHALARLFPTLLQVDAIFSSPAKNLEISDPVTLRRRALAALRELLARLAKRQPLVLWVDDLQWADTDSTSLLEELLRQPDAPALLLITSFRTEDIDQKPFLQSLLARAGGAAEIELSVDEISSDEARELTRALIGRGLVVTDGLLESIVREARGNPFLIEQLCHYAMSTDRSATTGISLSVMLDAGIEQLPRGARALLQILAVAGRPINQEVAYQAAGLTGDELPLISSLRAAQLLRSGGSNFGVELYHDRIRETLYEQLELPQVKQIHRRLAQTLEARGIDDPESLFEHYLGADERVRAAGHAAAAAKRAAAALAFDRAANFYRQALSCL